MAKFYSVLSIAYVAMIGAVFVIVPLIQVFSK